LPMNTLPCATRGAPVIEYTVPGSAVAVLQT
jgi:hypothetical protein